jgi:hypothetical protein
MRLLSGLFGLLAVLLSVLAVVSWVQDEEGQPVATPTVSEKTLFLMDDPEAIERWSQVHDGVMGGLSTGDLAATDHGTAVFSGKLSLENNGGFASVRSQPAEMDLTGHEGVALRAKGDGRTYLLCLKDRDARDGFLYQADLPTREGEWTTTRISFEEFVPTRMGQAVNSGPIDPSKVRSVTLMLADKQAGPYRLEVHWINAYPPVRYDADPLWDLSDPAAVSEWYTVQDRVMGGVSDGFVGPSGRGTALFAGDVSLENNGGFASLRSPPGEHDLGDYDGVAIRLRGDGKTYKLSLRPQGGDYPTYQASFETEPRQWRTVTVPFDKLVPTYRGRVLEGPTLDISRVGSVGILISDKQEGPFEFEVEWIGGYAVTDR